MRPEGWAASYIQLLSGHGSPWQSIINHGTSNEAQAEPAKKHKIIASRLAKNAFTGAPRFRAFFNHCRVFEPFTRHTYILIFAIFFTRSLPLFPYECACIHFRRGCPFLMVIGACITIKGFYSNDVDVITECVFFFERGWD